MKKALYFAYGRNMLLDAIESRVGPVEKVGTLTLNGYKLVFNTGVWWAYANLVEDENESVEGVLYDLTSEQIYRLDGFEGYPRNYQKRYFTTAEGDIVFAYISTKKFMQIDSLPMRNYVMDLYNGAKENGLEKTRDFLRTYLAEVLKRPLKKKKIKE